jgi:putative glutamine amidotransferase
MTIAISRCSGTENYEKYATWLMEADSDIICIDLYHKPYDSCMKIIDKCDGLLLSGGPDIDPQYYNEDDPFEKCIIDGKRDTLEFMLIQKAKELKLPVLGICRGLQELNVAYGGSLYRDLPTEFSKEKLHQCENDTCEHPITIVAGSILQKNSGLSQGAVNSYHHQGIKKLADCFIPTAFSADSLIEAIEWKEPQGKPFMIAVQYHPERLDHKSSLSLPLARLFLFEVRRFRAAF